MELRIFKKIQLLLVLLCCVALAFTAAGCGSSQSTQKKTKKSNLPAIGKVQSGKYVYTINTTNNTGKTITGFTIKDSSMESYPENMIGTKKTFTNGQKRRLYYNAKSAIQKSSKKSTEELNASFSIQLTFDDNSTAELHNVPFDDIKRMEIDYDQNQSLAYLVYVSKGTKEKVNTLNDEIKIKQDAEAAAAAQAQQQAEAQASAARQSSSTSSTRSSSSSSSTSSSSVRNTQSSRSATRSTTAPRSTRSAAAPSASRNAQPSSSGSSGASSSGCVGDGAMY